MNATEAGSRRTPLLAYDLNCDVHENLRRGAFHNEASIAQAADSYQDGDMNPKRRDSLRHRFGLPPGEHTVKVVVLGEPMFDSPGSDVSIESLIVFEAL